MTSEELTLADIYAYRFMLTFDLRDQPVPCKHGPFTCKPSSVKVYYVHGKGLYNVRN